MTNPDMDFAEEELNVFPGLVSRLDFDANHMTITWRDVDTGEEVIRAEIDLVDEDVVWQGLYAYRSWRQQNFLTTITAELPKVFRSHGYKRSVILGVPTGMEEIFHKVGYESGDPEQGEGQLLIGNLSPNGKLVRTAKARLK